MSPDTPHTRALTVTAFHPRDAQAWDRFVEACPEATFFHRIGWRRIFEEVLGHRTHYLAAKVDGEIAGVLPLVERKSLLFGKALISSPFCVYGGVAAVAEEARSALEEAACRLAHGENVDYLELRHRAPRHRDWPAKRDQYATFRKAIDPDPEANFARIRRKQRAEIRKGIEAGLTAEVDPHIDRFFPVYAESVRNLGTPVFPKRYLRALKEEFGEDCEILSVVHEGRVVSGVMSFYFRDEILPYYGGGTRQARPLSANDFMYWELMRRAALNGVGRFDFGRSKCDSGAYHFKRHWGFEPEPLHYEYQLVRSAAVPDVSPANPKYRALIAAWQRLPLSVARTVGPWIARSLG